MLLFVLYVNNFTGLYDLVVKCIKYKLDLLFLRTTGGGGWALWEELGRPASGKEACQVL